MMKLLKVTIVNIDLSFVWLFDSIDKRKCARKALDDLIANDGFFNDNLIFTQFPDGFSPPVDNAFGILLLPGDEEYLDHKLNSEDTYWITIEEYEVGTRVFGEVI